MRKADKDKEKSDPKKKKAIEKDFQLKKQKTITQIFTLADTMVKCQNKMCSKVKKKKSLEGRFFDIMK